MSNIARELCKGRYCPGEIRTAHSHKSS